MGKNFTLALLLPKYQAEKELQRTTRTYAGINIWQGLAITSAVVFASLYYLVVANATATSGYAINQVQSQMNSLLQQQKQLEISLAEMQSISSVQGVPQVAGMVQVSSVTYLHTGTGNLAAN